MDPEPSRASCGPAEALMSECECCVCEAPYRLALLKDLCTRLLEIVILPYGVGLLT